MLGLTERQGAVLDFIKLYIHEKVRPPTLREIGTRFGIRSTNGINDHLRALERKGYIVRDDMTARGIRVVPLDEVHPRGEPNRKLAPCPHCGRSGRAA